MQSKPVLSPVGERPSSRSHGLPGHAPGVSDPGGLGVICILKKFPGDADASGPGTTLREPLG